MLCRLGKSRSFLPLHVPRAPLRIWGCWDLWGTVGENRLLCGQGGRDLPVVTCLPQPGCWGSGQVRQVVCKGETPHPRSETSPSQDPIPLSWDFGEWVEGDLGDFSLLTSELLGPLQLLCLGGAAGRDPGCRQAHLPCCCLVPNLTSRERPPTPAAS